MGMQCVMGAVCACTFGAAPTGLLVLPTNMVMGPAVPAANIMDGKPIVNLPTFGMCMTPSNPMVAAATAAALGVLTPMPCIPMTVAPWIPANPMVLLANMPVLDNGGTLMCAYGGVITVSFAGQVPVLD